MVATRVQLTTGGLKVYGLKVYLEAIEGAFGNDIDDAMLLDWAAAQPTRAGDSN